MAVQAEAGSSCRLMIRLFGALAIDDGGRTRGPSEFGGIRPKQVLEILLAARGPSRADGADRGAALGDGPARRTSSARSTRSSPFSAVALSPTATARVSSWSRSRRRIASPRIWSSSTSISSTSCSCARRGSRLRPPAARSPRRSPSCAARSWKTSRTRTGRRTCATRIRDACSEPPGRRRSRRWPSSTSPTRSRTPRRRRHSIVSASARTALQMLALYALGRAARRARGYRGFRARLDEELGLAPTPETRALEAAVLRQDDVRSLLPRPIVHESADGGARSVGLLGRTRELGTLERAVASGARRLGHAADSARGRVRVGKTRLLDELATRSRRRPRRAAQPARSSSDTFPTCRSRPRSATRSPESRSTDPAAGAPPRSCPSSPSMTPGRQLVEVDALEAAGRADRRARAARAASSTTSSGPTRDDRRTQLPAAPLRRARRRDRRAVRQRADASGSPGAPPQAGHAVGSNR